MTQEEFFKMLKGEYSKAHAVGKYAAGRNEQQADEAKYAIENAMRHFRDGNLDPTRFDSVQDALNAMRELNIREELAQQPEQDEKTRSWIERTVYPKVDLAKLSKLKGSDDVKGLEHGANAYEKQYGLIIEGLPVKDVIATSTKDIHNDLYRIALAALTTEKVFEAKSEGLAASLPKPFKGLLENSSENGFVSNLANKLSGDPKGHAEEAARMYSNALEALRQVYTGEIVLDHHQSVESVISTAVQNNRTSKLINGATEEELDQQHPRPDHDRFEELYADAQKLESFETKQAEAANELQEQVTMNQRNGNYATPGTELENLVAEGQEIVKIQVNSAAATAATPTEMLPQEQ